MTFEEVMKELEAKGNPGTKKVLIKHGAREPFFGVRVGDLKPIQKKIKKDYELSLKLYDTGNSDAMYLAGLIADESKMKKRDLEKWAKNAYWYMISEYTVPWIAAESKFGLELGQKWIESPKENIAVAGWSALANLIAVKDDTVYVWEYKCSLTSKSRSKAIKQLNRAERYLKSQGYENIVKYFVSGDFKIEEI